MVDNRFIGILADEETIMGFMLCGLEESKDNPNFVAVTNETPEEDLVKVFTNMAHRDDLSVLFVSDFVVGKIKSVIDANKRALPNVMEIPSKFGLDA